VTNRRGLVRVDEGGAHGPWTKDIMKRTRPTARLALAGLAVVAALADVSATSSSAAQTPETPPARVPALTLDEALRRAEAHPSVVAAFEEVNGAAAGLAAARSMSWRWNEPFAFGPQSPATGRAQAALARARADEQLARFNAQVEAAAAFLAVVHAQDALTAATADAKRRAAAARVASALTNGRRGGVEATTQAETERVAADQRVVLARRTLAVAQAELGRATGGGTPVTTAGSLPRLAAVSPGTPDHSTTLHPALQVHVASVEEQHAPPAVLHYAFWPQTQILPVLSARGGIGLVAVLPAGLDWKYDWTTLLARERADRAGARAAARAAMARLEDAQLSLASQRQIASAMIEAAGVTAVNTSAHVAAAQRIAAQALVGFEAGRGRFVDLADAQALLARAVLQDADARANVWRALLDEAVARGDLAPLIARASSVAAGQASAGNDAAFVQALRAGGLVLVMRHASSPQEAPAPGAANPDNTNRERQLDEKGRQGATAVGDALRALRIPIGRVLASPTYRVQETTRYAKLAGVTAVEELGDNAQGMAKVSEAQAAWLRTQTRTAAPSGNLLLVTHQPNFTLAFPDAGGIAEGEMVVFRPDGRGGSAIVGRIRVEDWARLRAVP
jgi:phosphohistidine phosphatase SixA